MSIDVSPYNRKGTGDGSGVLVGGLAVLIGGLGVLVGWGVGVCPGEHAKRRNAKVEANRYTLVFT